MASMMFPQVSASRHAIADLFRQVRARTMEIVAPLEIEDYVIQTAEFMSPPRWHIGHTSWFFETLLQSYKPGYKTYSEEFLFYFNSYYEGFGTRIERPKRGTKSRPTVKETIAYRNRIDDQMLSLLDSLNQRREANKILALIRLGLEHEMQHQELLVYDIKHLLCDQFDAPAEPAPRVLRKVERMSEIEGGLFWLGYGTRSNVSEELRTASGGGDRIGSSQGNRSEGITSIGTGNGDELPPSEGFAFDNEKPAHQVFLKDFFIDRAPVSNGDFLEFIRDRGYQDYRWWFSEGWETVNREQWQAPLYWEFHDSQWMIRDFTGLNTAESKGGEPVTHVSYYEASAFAKWAGKRLPTEAEWEKAACVDSAGKTRAFPWGDEAADATRANLFENGLWSVAPIGAFPEGQSAHGCEQMIGDVWEWTTSDYVPYPGFKSEFDEYNDKWFVNQKVLRGGSFATPLLHIRSTYRNFFHAHERWMISGFRCAKDV